MVGYYLTTILFRMKKKIQNNKYRMPPLIARYYQSWINSPTLFNHPCDRKRFHKFVKAYIRFSREKRGEHWLRHFLEKDLSGKYKDKDFVEKEIQRILYVFSNLIEFDKVPFSLYSERWYDCYDEKTKKMQRHYT